MDTFSGSFDQSEISKQLFVTVESHRRDRQHDLVLQYQILDLLSSPVLLFLVLLAPMLQTLVPMVLDLMVPVPMDLVLTVRLLPAEVPMVLILLVLVPMDLVIQFALLLEVLAQALVCPARMAYLLVLQRPLVLLILPAPAEFDPGFLRFRSEPCCPRD